MPNDIPPPFENAENEDLLFEDDVEIIDEFEIVEAYEEESAPIQDDSELTFAKHEKAVFCCSINSELSLAVSGGEDDRAFVWNLTNGNIVFECTGHEDSVVAAAFNYDSSMIATADMSGIIQVWDILQKEKIWDFTTADIRWMQWFTGKNILIAGTAIGDCWLWHIPDGDTTIFPSLGVPCSCGIVMDDERVAVGYDNGSIRIWDHQNAVVLNEIGGHLAHKGSVIKLAYHNGLIVSGSFDGTAKLILATTGKVLKTFQCGDVTASEEKPDSVESIVFMPNQQAIVTGTLQGSIAVWDIGSHVQRLRVSQETTVVKIYSCRTLPSIFTGGLDGIIRMYDIRTGNLESSWKGHTSHILDFDLSRDEKIILTASEDGTCKIFKNGQP